MTGLGLLFVTFASVGYAVLDVQRKMLAARLRVVPLLFWLVAGPLPLWLLWTWWQPPEQVLPVYWAWALGTVVANIGANLLYLEALRASGLGATIPLLSLTPVFTALLGLVLLAEVPGAREWAGILLVVVGAVRLQLGSATVEGRAEGEARGLWQAWWARLRRERGGLLMAGVALLWSVTPALDKRAMEASGPAFHGLVLHVGIVLGLLPLVLRQGQEGGPASREGEGGAGGSRSGLASLLEARRHAWLLAGAVVVTTLALGFQLLALERVFAGFVETFKRGVGSASALILGAWWFGERVSLRAATSVTMMALGVAAILW